MKKLTTLILIIGFGAFVSCSHEEEGVTMNSNESLLTTKSLKDKTGLLFTYSTPTQGVDSVKTAFEQLILDAYDEIDGRSLTHVVSVVEVGDGKGELKEVYFIDLPRNYIVESFTLNPLTGILDSNGSGGQVYEPTSGMPIFPALGFILNMPCPLGYTAIATCPYGPSAGSCITMAVGSFQYNNSTTGTNTYILHNSLTAISMCAIGGQ